MDFEPQLHEFAKCCTRAGYAVRAITVDQVDFVLVPRPRSAEVRNARACLRASCLRERARATALGCKHS
eukprot:1623506-Pyramimonas_sp.AAC.1